MRMRIPSCRDLFQDPDYASLFRCLQLSPLRVGVVTSEEYVRCPGSLVSDGHALEPHAVLLRRFFLKLDLNRDGKISFQEYKEHPVCSICPLTGKVRHAAARPS